jgi:hypothetical protein
MTQTLQQALLKAGLVSKEKLKKVEEEKKKAARPHHDKGGQGKSQQAQKKSVGFIEGKHHHHIRTECEACGKTLPDVEYYEHKNKSLDKCWLCVRCADAYNILDEYRQTVQSQHAKSGLFRREYGATKVFK